MVSFPKISPNLLLGVGGIIAAVFLVNQVRKAGGDVQKALSDISLPDISLPEIKFPDVSFPDISFPDFSLPSLPSVFADTPDQTILDPTQAPFTVTEEQRSEGVFTQKETDMCPCGVSIVQNPDRTFTSKCLLCADGSGVTTRCGVGTVLDPNTGKCFPIGAAGSSTPQPSPIPESVQQPITEQTFEVISELPTEQEFGFGGEGFVGGTVRENPIDTLSEVLKFFPELTASQAADFLAETGGQILPSEVELVDPDIKNIIAAGGDIPVGEQIQVDTSPQDRLSALEEEAARAAQTSCELFGLNCDLVDSQMAWG